MQGAREYAGLFSRTEQVGRLFIASGSHARGDTLHIWVLPAEYVQPPGTYPGSNAVEVYGIMGGNPGWTEYYGWLRRGPWEEDFKQIVAERRAAADKRKVEREAKQEVEKREAEERANALLASYASR